MASGRKPDIAGHGSQADHPNVSYGWRAGVRLARRGSPTSRGALHEAAICSGVAKVLVSGNSRSCLTGDFKMKRLAFLTATMLTGLAACSPGGSSSAPASNAPPSSAQPAAAAPATPQSTQASFDSLRSNGYMITSVTDIPNEEQTAIWPNQQTLPYLMITLQKGASTAVCTMDTLHFLTLDDTTMKTATLCYQR